MNRFFKAFMSVTIISVATRCLCFFFKIFLSRTLSLEMLGSYQIAMNIFMVFVAIVASGLPITLSREVAFEVSRGDFDLANKKATAGLTLAGGLSVLSFICLFAISLFIPDGTGDFLQIASFSLLFFGIYSVSRGYLWGKREFFAFSFLEFLEELITFIFAFIFLKIAFFDSSIQNVALGFVVSSVVCGILGIWSFFRKGGTIIFAKSQISKVAKSSSFITVMRIAGTAFASLYTICLPKFLVASGFSSVESLQLVGLFYGMVVPLLFIPSSLVSGLSLVLVPEVASFADNKMQVRKTLGFAMQFAILFAVVFIPFYWVFGSEITTFLFKNSESGEFLKYACIAVLPISLNLLLSSFMNSLGLEKSNFLHFMASGIACFCFLYPATLLWGEYGVVVMFVLQPTIPAILNLRTLAVQAEMRKSTMLKFLAPTLLLPPCLIISLLMQGVTASLPAFLALAFSGIGIFLFCGGLFYVFFYPEGKKIGGIS